MDRREFIKLVSATVITVSFPEVVTAAMRQVGCKDIRNVADLILQDVEIVAWNEIRGTDVATIRAFVPFKGDTLWVTVTASERLLSVHQGVGIVVKDLMDAAKYRFKADKNIDITFEGYKLPKRILDKSR